MGSYGECFGVGVPNAGGDLLDLLSIKVQMVNLLKYCGVQVME